MYMIIQSRTSIIIAVVINNFAGYVSVVENEVCVKNDKHFNIL